MVFPVLQCCYPFAVRLRVGLQWLCAVAINLSIRQSARRWGEGWHICTEACTEITLYWTGSCGIAVPGVQSNDAESSPAAPGTRGFPMPQAPHRSDQGGRRPVGLFRGGVPVCGERNGTTTVFAITYGSDFVHVPYYLPKTTFSNAATRYTSLLNHAAGSRGGCVKLASAMQPILPGPSRSCGCARSATDFARAWSLLAPRSNACVCTRSTIHFAGHV